jgi:hypothetical protein
MPMQKQFKLMLLANAIIGILFLLTNYVYYYFAVHFDGHSVIWNPLWLTYYNAKEAAELGHTLGVSEPNFSFYFFWIVVAVNVYFLYRLQKSAYLKQ